jgi:hypothetical protein
MMSGPDQREYFRIDDRLTIEFRRVAGPEFERLENIIRHSPSYGADRVREICFPSEVMSQRQGGDEELYAYLRVLEKKLDMILALLGRQEDDLGYKSLTTHVSISGAGVRFVADEPLIQGERVEVRLSLPIAPFPKISTLCEVVRVKESTEDGTRAWTVAVKFLVVNDHDRDVLINYIFAKEREKLRSEKGTG